MNKKKKELDIFAADTTSHVELPLPGSGVSAGFPSPAEDYMAMKLDLNKELVRNPAATFYARVNGVSMTDDGIDDGDLLLIDRSVEPADGCIAVCFVDGEFTLKRLRIDSEGVTLVPANKRYRPIRITADNDFMIWGVVRYVIKRI